MNNSLAVTANCKIQSSYQLLSLSTSISISRLFTVPVPRPPLDVISFLYFPPRILFSSLRVWFSFRKDHALQLECGNYIFIVSVAKLSSKNVDSRPGPHLT